MASPTRWGRAKNLTLEPEAVAILERLAGNTRSQGRLVSTLLRQEERKRQEMRVLRERLAQTVQEVLVTAPVDGLEGDGPTGDVGAAGEPT
jgi:hypothetical protein